MPDFLVIGAVGWAITSGIGSVVQINRFFPQCLIQLFQRSRLRTAKKIRESILPMMVSALSL